MKNKLIFIFLSITIMFMGTASAATIDVGSGYTYTTVQSGVAAANSGDSIHVHTGTYNMPSGSIYLKSSTKLYGDGIGKTILYGSSTSGGEQGGSFQGMLEADSKSNIEIYGFTFTSDCPNEDATGHGDARGCIRLLSCTNVNIHDCSVKKYVYMDFITCQGSSYVNVYNCSGQCGHDFVQGTSHLSNLHVWNCDIHIADNSGVRSDYGTNIMVDHCTFTNTEGGGYACFEAEDTISNNTMTKCVFHDLGNAVSVGVHASGPLSVIDNVGWSCGSVNYGTSTNNRFSVSNHDLSYWISQGYGAGASIESGGSGGGSNDTPDQPIVTTVYNGTPAISLSSPTNGTTTNTIRGNITFSWTDYNSTSYRVQVSNTSNFSYLLYNGTSDSGSSSVALGNGTYYWRVAAHIDGGANAGTWTNYTTSWFLIIAGDVASKTGVYGKIYSNSNLKPIEGATVYIVSLDKSWSESQVTGADGYYQFDVNYNSGIYYITSSATGFETVPVSPGLPLNTSSYDYMQLDIALTESPSYFPPHDVKFYVRDSNNNIVKGAEVDLYKSGNDPIMLDPDLKGTTDTMSGLVTYNLNAEINYTVITTYGNATDTESCYPWGTEYYIYLPVNTAIIIPDMQNVINVSVTHSEIVNNQATISVNYTDIADETNTVNFAIGQYANNNTFIPLNITGTKDNWNGAEFINNTANDTFTVNNSLGKTYVVRVIENTQNYGIQEEDYAVAFPGSNLPFSDKPEMSYACIILLVLTGGAAGYLQRKVYPLVVTVLFWAMWFCGAFKPLDLVFYQANATASIIGGIAFLFAVATYMKEGEE